MESVDFVRKVGQSVGRAKPMIILTDLSDERNVANCYKAGGTCVVPKPFDVDDWVATLKQLASLAPSDSHRLRTPESPVSGFLSGVATRCYSTVLPGKAFPQSNRRNLTALRTAAQRLRCACAMRFRVAADNGLRVRPMTDIVPEDGAKELASSPEMRPLSVATNGRDALDLHRRANWHG